MLCLSGFELYSRWVLLMSKRAGATFNDCANFIGYCIIF